MHIPGFVAELSLHNTNEQYGTLSDATPTRGGVYPAWSVQDMLDENTPSLTQRLCWLPYWWSCFDRRRGPYPCMRYLYIC